jgi:hypothetical protein
MRAGSGRGKLERRALLLSPLVPAALAWGREKAATRFDQTFAARADVIDIDLVNGPVTVRSTRRNDIRVTAEAEWEAELKEDLALGQQEVRFEPRLEGNVFRVWVEMPRERRWDRYQVRHRVTVDMPAGMRLIARTVNGTIQASYEAVPVRDVYLRTVNGDVDLELPRGADADFQMKTVNGSVYSAWDLQPLAGETKVTESGMKRIVSRTRYAGGRLGKGGVAVRMEGINGDIRVRERKA